MNSLEVRLESDWLFIYDGGSGINTSISLTSPPTWNFVALVVQDKPAISMANVTVYFNGSEINTRHRLTMFMLGGETPQIFLGDSFVESSGFFPDEEDVALFNGTMQDVGIYSRSLTEYELMMLAQGQVSVSGASFLPQCLCMPDGHANNADPQQCDDGSIR